MALQISVISEQAKHENRVALSPEVAKKLIAMGCQIKMQSGAGASSFLPDQVFADLGVTIEKTAATALKGADLVFCVNPPSDAQIKSLKKDTVVIGMLSPHANADLLKTLAEGNIQSFSMEMVPRITRAQSMDVLSSQANLAGYKAILDACEHYPRAMPMMMTAAGTVPPAKVFVMGAGVAGLQAIATAKRLGAIVTATDVRPAAKEQVESLGANFVAVENEEFREAETAGGYAKAMSKDYQKLQAELIETHIEKQDIVITTALIPGREAPKLINAAMVKSMKPGSVIVDMAVQSGGNCAGSKLGEVVTTDGVTIVGHANIPSRIAGNASALYAQNLLAFATLLIQKDEDALSLNLNTEDEIIAATLITQGGKIVHSAFSESTKKTKKGDSKKD